MLTSTMDAQGNGERERAHRSSGSGKRGLTAPSIDQRCYELPPRVHRVLRIPVVQAIGVGVDLRRGRRPVQTGPHDMDGVVGTDREAGVVAVEDVAVLALGGRASVRVPVGATD